MTDHNAEGGKMVEPCGLCGNSTYKIYSTGDMTRGCNCFDISDDGDYCVDEWNEMQKRIRARREDDFDAGYEAGYWDTEWSITEKREAYVAKVAK